MEPVRLVGKFAYPVVQVARDLGERFFRSVSHAFGSRRCRDDGLVGVR